jgi:hypothetical protein
MQRVYHVVFATTFHKNVVLSRASRRNDRRQEERDREAFDLIVSFCEHASMLPSLVWPDVQLQLIEHRRHVASLSGNEGTDLSTSVDKLVCNLADSLLDPVGGPRALDDGSLTSWGGEKWKVCGRGLRTGYAIPWAR